MHLAVSYNQNQMKYIILTLILGILLPSMKCNAQVYTMSWDPSSITSEQKKYLDTSTWYYYDTLGNKLNGSTSFDSRRAWLSGTHVEYVEIDSSAKTVSRKWRLATDEEKEEWKKEILERSSIKNIIGQKMSDLTFTDLNGVTYQYSDLIDKVVYLNFWFVGCYACELERVKLNQLYEKYHEEVLFLSISKSNERKTKAHLDKNEHLWPVVIMDKELKNNFPFVLSFPTNILINNGKYELALAGLSEGTFLVIEETLERFTQ